VVLGRGGPSGVPGWAPTVDEKDRTGQLVGDYMIWSSEEEREGA
jgi:hypothetical protein